MGRRAGRWCRGTSGEPGRSKRLITLLQVLVSGVLAGGVYALISVGLTLVFGVMRVINFAHGEFLMVGMYAALAANQYLGLDPYVSILLIGPIFFGLGMLVHRLVILPLVVRGMPHATQAIATLGLSVVILNIVLMLASGRSMIVTTAYTTAVIELGQVALSVPRLAAFSGALLATGLIYLLLQRTYVGMAIRATAQDRGASDVLGIPTARIDAITFGLATACVGVAGAMMVPFFYVNPTVGSSLGLIAYIVVVLGGMGSIFGAFLGGIAIGVIEALTGYFVDPGLKEVAYLVVFVAVLVLRPSGLLGVPGSEKIAA